MSAATVRLSPEDVRAIALEIVELLEERTFYPGRNTQRRLVDAATLAAELGVGRAWVYEHKDALGAEPLGEGERPRLRFDLERARQLRGGELPIGNKAPAVARRRRSSTPTTLLPIRDEVRA